MPTANAQPVVEEEVIGRHAEKVMAPDGHHRDGCRPSNSDPPWASVLLETGSAGTTHRSLVFPSPRRYAGRNTGGHGRIRGTP